MQSETFNPKTKDMTVMWIWHRASLKLNKLWLIWQDKLTNIFHLKPFHIIIPHRGNSRVTVAGRQTYNKYKNAKKKYVEKDLDKKEKIQYRKDYMWCALYTGEQKCALYTFK